MGAPAALLASEQAEFWNLGFSQNGSIFAFAQYWVTTNGSAVNAELYIVDTARNTFVEGGQHQFQERYSLSAGNDGRNAVLKLIDQKDNDMRLHKINYLEQGRIIYLDLDDRNLNDSISFKDFENNKEYAIDLKQRVNENSAAFHINGRVRHANGAWQPFTVGLANYFRPDVLRYEIAQILVASDAHVFVVEQLVSSRPQQTSTRYMVETAVID